MAAVRDSLAVVAARLDPILAVRVSFVLAAAIVLVVYAVPAFRNRFLSYGSRSSSHASSPSTATAASRKPQRISTGSGDNGNTRTGATSLEQLMDVVTSLQVPHSYFSHFYLLSILASAFWAHQSITHGPAITWIASRASITHPDPSMSAPQVLLCWTLMSTQALRRLYECTIFRTPSASAMWIGHYLLGLAFYAGMSLAIWIEGSPALLLDSPAPLLDVAADALRLLRLSKLAALVLFVQASAGQHLAHRHLYELRTRAAREGSSLQKKQQQGQQYSLPTHPLFRRTLTPHYACECLIYFALCVIGTPPGALFNVTLGCALLFVAVNLGVTADGTREWYAAKFGEDAVKGKARMIPKIW